MTKMMSGNIFGLENMGWV